MSLSLTSSIQSTRLEMPLRSSATRVDDGCWRVVEGMEALGSWLDLEVAQSPASGTEFRRQFPFFREESPAV